MAGKPIIFGAPSPLPLGEGRGEGEPAGDEYVQYAGIFARGTQNAKSVLANVCWKLELSRRFCWRYITRFLIGIIHRYKRWLSRAGGFPARIETTNDM